MMMVRQRQRAQSFHSAHKEMQGARIDARLRDLVEVERHVSEALGDRGDKPLEVDLAALIDECRETRDEDVAGRLATGSDRRERL
jgi:hypothetical protein